MTRREPAGLYVHIPFCRSKCLYCDFYSVASSSAIPAWLKAVQQEALLYKDRFHEFDSLYLGGGTPTILDERELSTLMSALSRCFTFSPGSEITIEANPDDITPDKLKVIKGFGINRISLGVQSLDDEDLKYLGRRHSAKQALGAIHTIRSCGFGNMGVDLIYGFEGQSPAAWKRTIGRILEYKPEHLSCYQMTLERGAPFWKMKEAGRVRSIGEKLAGAFFILTSRILERRGYTHYEVSNFARGREVMSRHNRKYWRHVPYLGLGPSAHSFENGCRWWNVKSVKKYAEILAEGKVPVEGREILSGEQLELESLSLGLRTKEGVSLEMIEAGYALGEGLRGGAVLKELQKSGLAKLVDGRIQPTRRGFLVADSLPLMFYR